VVRREHVRLRHLSRKGESRGAKGEALTLGPKFVASGNVRAGHRGEGEVPDFSIAMSGAEQTPNNASLVWFLFLVYP